MAFITDSEAARAAFSTASERARNAVNSLFSSYGFTKQDPSGAWSTSIAGKAFDPTQFVSYSDGNVTVNTEAIRNLASGEFGTAFGPNRLSQTIGSGAAREALAKAALRGRGIMGGGLAGQAAGAAEAAQRLDLANLGSEFLGGLSDIYGGVGEAVGAVTQANIENTGTGAMTIAGATPVATSPSQAPASNAKPTSPGRMYERRGPWQYLGAQRGWVKK
jgi:hypothetical protein